MRVKRETILLLGAGTQALAIVRSLFVTGYKVMIVVSEKGNYGDVSRFVDKRLICALPVDSQDFLDYIEQLIEKEHVDVILPMGDVYAEFLSKNKSVLERYVRFTIPEYSFFLRGYDKNKLMSLCREKGYPHPLTIDLSHLCDLKKDEIKDFPYPALLKPNCTTGGRGMLLVHSHDELLVHYPVLHSKYGDYHLQRYIPEGGRQVKVQLCVDEKGNLLNSSVLHKVRWYPVNGGASSCAVTIDCPEIVKVCHQVLKDIRWEGFADFDLIEDPWSKELLIMEINPRLPACIGAAIHAGVDWGLIMVDQALGHPQKKYTYQQGVTLRHLGFDVLWFLKAHHRFHTNPSWFNFLGKTVYYQDVNGWNDPMPFLIGTIENIKKLINPTFRKSKQL